VDLTRAQWRTSSYSSGNGGQCIQVAHSLPDAIVAVRDSKDPQGPSLAFTPGNWQAFTDQVKAGVLDLAGARFESR
jgi:hypothetical protein